MRFYGVSLSEVMGWTPSQFFYLGERMVVLKTEELIERLIVAENIHTKEPMKLRTQLQATLDADRMAISSATTIDRAGLAKLKGIMQKRIEATKKK